jgi:NADP-dependent 3-hydroxy acid dehydrogenase YdfG
MRDHGSNSEADVVLVLNAGTDTGSTIARELLNAGFRVAVTGRQASALTRILPGYSSDQVLAIAADTDDRSQLSRLISRVESRFGRIDAVVGLAQEDGQQPQRRALRLVTDDGTARRVLGVAS